VPCAWARRDWIDNEREVLGAWENPTPVVNG
jgi:hypothetical protein